MPYIGKSPQNGVRNRFVYQATAGQTSFSGSDADSKVLTYQDGLYLDVYPEWCTYLNPEQTTLPLQVQQSYWSQVHQPKRRS